MASRASCEALALLTLVAMSPVGGDDAGYPTIGSVAVNYQVIGSVSSISTAIYTGTTSPAGPFYYLAQSGFGPKYLFKETWGCVTALTGALGSMVKLLQQVVKIGVARFGPNAVDTAIAELDEGAATSQVVFGTEAVAAFFAALAAPELIFAITAAGLTITVLAAVVLCLSQS